MSALVLCVFLCRCSPGSRATHPLGSSVVVVSDRKRPASGQMSAVIKRQSDVG